MKLDQWFAQRGAGYVRQRAAALLGRYGLTPAKAEERVLAGVDSLARLGCAPTFPVPARVVQRHPRYFRGLQDRGVEIAVHGYDHVALAAYPPAEASAQLARAVDVFRRQGLESHGFRCPYLSCSSELLQALPQGLLGYSSNRAIRWDVVPAGEGPPVRPAIAAALSRAYRPESAQERASVPALLSGLVEIPVCLPDDLELLDARGLGPEAAGEVWSRVLVATHRRGESFVLMFHPELMDACLEPLSAVLARASELRPAVWVARLRDIGSWWREKAGFSLGIESGPDGLHLSFVCSERATILVRGLDAGGAGLPWDGLDRRLAGPELHVPAEPRPFVGLDPDAPAETAAFLRDQGYLLDTGQTASKCAIYLDAATLGRLKSEVELMEFIEATRGPLVRYGRWPNGAKSVLSITGDLDALTLWDYATRLLTR